MQRASTEGYLVGLLEMMWAGQGQTRPEHPSVFADIEMIHEFAKQYAFVRVFCFEPEQILLCQKFERRLLRLFDRSIAQLRKNSTKS